MEREECDLGLGMHSRKPEGHLCVCGRARNARLPSGRTPDRCAHVARACGRDTWVPRRHRPAVPGILGPQWGHRSRAQPVCSRWCPPLQPGFKWPPLPFPPSAGPPSDPWGWGRKQPPNLLVKFPQCQSLYSWGDACMMEENNY